MSNTITATEFLTFFDEFKKVPIPKIDAFIGVASIRVNAQVWGAVAKYGTALLTAHMLTMTGPGGLGSGGGAVTGESVGDLSRNFATVGEAGSGDAQLNTTRYGQDFIALRNETIVTPMATGPATEPGVWPW